MKHKKVIEIPPYYIVTLIAATWFPFNSSSACRVALRRMEIWPSAQEKELEAGSSSVKYGLQF
jgi:hypothetical protein